ncbi:hypothetical protein H257_03472 [Aphanomyces astaci]|uniref:Uncharacterized protein n=1 Tax=Aphanomyces astaci TaxID=112090 RepID=W4GWY9_APHAT|nr:hypothetical protein H257_03472 [Aphanomyces astaci]ETV84187.1 hypothetical protein H257_03472 [Aphanomyces astaci]|eukprot:XP_009825879.1 hypothetical protein H257_03472 [Aphanomyces astaci]
MQRERLTVEFPENFRCHITTKVGKPLGKSRTSVGKPTELTVASDTTFGVVSALVVDNVSAAIADYHADASNAKLLWDSQVPTEVYVKVAANTTQDKYTKITLVNYTDVLRQVWDNASKVRNAQASFTLQLFIYAGKDMSTAIRRATSNNLVTAAARVAGYIEDQSMALGPLQTEYATLVTAHLPPSAPVEIPTNTTMQQLGHIDVMAARHADERRHEMNSQTTETYRRVRVRFGTMASAPVDCFLLVEDLRSILGIPPFDLTPSYREPFVGEVVGPSVNMDDIDHINL